MRLHVRVVRPEELARTRPRKFLRRVDRQAPRIPALPRIALGVLVHQHRARRLAARAGRGVLGCDQIDLGVLLLRLRLNRRVDLGVVVHQARAIRETLRALQLPATALMTSLIGDRRPEEGLRNRLRIRRRNDIRPETENVRPVVLSRHLRRVNRRANRRTDVLEAVRRHRHANAGAADKNAEIGVSKRDILRHLDRIVGIVAALAVRRTPVRHLIRARERLHKRPLQFKPAVVGSNRNFHLRLLWNVKIWSVLYQKLT